MTEPTPLRRPRPRAATLGHDDISQLISTLQRQADVFEQLVPHVPTLIEMASAWGAGKTAGRAVGRTARWAGAFGKWLGSVTLGAVVIWVVVHHKWELLLQFLRA